MIAEETGYPMGAFVMITHSAHIYSDDYALVEKILTENYEKELGYTSRSMFEEDPPWQCYNRNRRGAEKRCRQANKICHETSYKYDV